MAGCAGHSARAKVRDKKWRTWENYQTHECMLVCKVCRCSLRAQQPRDVGPRAPATICGTYLRKRRAAARGSTHHKTRGAARMRCNAPSASHLLADKTVTLLCNWLRTGQRGYSVARMFCNASEIGTVSTSSGSEEVLQRSRGNLENLAKRALLTHVCQ